MRSQRGYCAAAGHAMCATMRSVRLGMPIGGAKHAKHRGAKRRGAKRRGGTGLMTGCSPAACRPRPFGSSGSSPCRPWRLEPWPLRVYRSRFDPRMAFRLHHTNPLHRTCGRSHAQSVPLPALPHQLSIASRPTQRFGTPDAPRRSRKSRTASRPHSPYAPSTHAARGFAAHEPRAARRNPLPTMRPAEKTVHIRLKGHFHSAFTLPKSDKRHSLLNAYCASIALSSLRCG